MRSLKKKILTTARFELASPKWLVSKTLNYFDTQHRWVNNKKNELDRIMILGESSCWRLFGASIHRSQIHQNLYSNEYSYNNSYICQCWENIKRMARNIKKMILALFEFIKNAFKNFKTWILSEKSAKNVKDLKKNISQMGKKLLTTVGFEPTPPKRLVPKTSALTARPRCLCVYEVKIQS